MLEATTVAGQWLSSSDKSQNNSKLLASCWITSISLVAYLIYLPDGCLLHYAVSHVHFQHTGAHHLVSAECQQMDKQTKIIGKYCWSALLALIHLCENLSQHVRHSAESHKEST